MGLRVVGSEVPPTACETGGQLTLHLCSFPSLGKMGVIPQMGGMAALTWGSIGMNQGPHALHARSPRVIVLGSEQGRGFTDSEGDSVVQSQQGASLEPSCGDRHESLWQGLVSETSLFSPASSEFSLP